MKGINKKTATLAILISLFALTAYNTGSPGGKTNAPNEGSCGETGCHQVAAIDRELITTNIPSTGYVPGDTYDISIFIEEEAAKKFGFELACYSQGGKRLNGLIGNDTVTSFSLNTRTTHKFANINGDGSKAWTFRWVAPETGYHYVTFYTSVIAANGNNTSSGDVLFKHSLQYLENGKASASLPVNSRISAYPNPCQDQITVDGLQEAQDYIIYSVNGEQVLSGNTAQVISVDVLLPGYYYIRLTGENSRVIPFVKN